jgi:DNA-nicking Smr family endonuclease
MKNRSESRAENGAWRPFKDLNRLIHKKSLRLKQQVVEPTVGQARPITDPHSEKALFELEMADVTPLDRKKARKTPPAPSRPAGLQTDTGEPADPLEPLARLIRSGEGFDVASTSEYVAGVGYQVHPALTEYLHRGRFSVQSHIDLHGLNVYAAREAFDAFMRESLSHGKRMVLIVHGRGLSSPADPVLKSKVCRWLTRGTWRKWVMAFSSARACDGGAGATYVLLRQRSVTKRCRKRVQSSRPG